MADSAVPRHSVVERRRPVASDFLKKAINYSIHKAVKELIICPVDGCFPTAQRFSRSVNFQRLLAEFMAQGTEQSIQL
jgi:hypothetical protein